MPARLLVLAAALLALPARLLAHCDTLDGPVARDTRAALEKRDPTLVLAWVGAGDEAEVRAAWTSTLAVRELGEQARALADRYFLETVVRLHRRGEGQPYVGLRPAGETPAHGLAAADEALASGSVESLATAAGARVGDRLRELHARVMAARRERGQGVEKGRAFVAAYVDYIHYAEAVLAPEAEPGAPEAEPRHRH